LDNRHVGLRLGLAFAVLIALLVGIGQFGLRRMHEINDTLSSITEGRSDKLQLAREVLTFSNRNSRITMEIFLLHDRAKTAMLLAERSENTEKISGLVAKIASRSESENEKRRLFAVEQMRKTYVDSYLRALHLLINEGKRDAAVAVMVNETLPALFKYHAALDEFVGFQTVQRDIAAKQAEVDYAKARRLESLLIILAMGVALAIAVFATRDTTREIATRTDAQREVSKLNANLEERVMDRTRELTDANKQLASEFEERRQAEERHHLQAAALAAAANAIVITDHEGKIVWVNRAFTGMTGYSEEDVLGKNARVLKSGEQSDSYYANLWSTISSGTVWQGEIVNRRKDGSIYTEEMTITPVTGDADNLANRYFIAMKQDITERKQIERALRQAEEKYRAIFEDAVVGIFRSTPGGRYIEVNPAMARMLGYDSAGELVANITDISRQVYVDPNRREELKRLLREQGTVKHFEYAIYRKDGSKLWFSENIRAISEDGVVVAYEGTNEDITDRKVAEERVQYLAYYDALTGLPNRTLLQDRLTKALADARRQKYKIALLFLDLDRFKDINDSLGHSVGDLFLQEVAERLKRFAREQDTVSRLGGDEFLIMLTHISDISDAAVAAERLMDAMTTGFVVQGHSLNVSCSIGISIFPEQGADCETLIKNADAAMYGAKESGRNNFRFFAEHMNARAAERLTLENSLRQALGKNELFLVYQPQMDIATGMITGLEALLRWQHPQLGLVPPDQFIRIAENSGLIVPIGEWVLRTACRQSRTWQGDGVPAVSVAVNVSAVQFRQEGFCQLIRRVLDETGLAPQYLELELTESLLLANADVTFSVLQELKDMGVTLAIDDFGTGYSSFNYLRQFRVSKLKIDRSFIRDIAVNPDDAAITTAIISMAKSLNLRVIAEGVENEAQMSFLRAHQCDEIQGYYFCKPLAVDKVADKLRGAHPVAKALTHASGKQA
jgi:diguanylate cyclase (GGDEF)-like protein/PAS domain S-box-containing protein